MHRPTSSDPFALAPDLLSITREFLSPKEASRLREVCRNWHKQESQYLALIHVLTSLAHAQPPFWEQFYQAIQNPEWVDLTNAITAMRENRDIPNVNSQLKKVAQAAAFYMLPLLIRRYPPTFHPAFAHLSGYGYPPNDSRKILQPLISKQIDEQRKLGKDPSDWE